MSPRRYRMAARAEAVGQTRRQIVSAAMAVHAERGVLATSWQDIAERAGVSIATVYRHFPTLAELIPACSRSVFDVIQPPSVDEARATFASLASAGERFDRLVRESCHCYAAGEGWLHAAQRERDFVPELHAALEIIEGSLLVLVSAAAGRRLSKADHTALFVLCNFPFWKALVDAGQSQPVACETVVRLVQSEVRRMELDRDGTPAQEPGQKPGQKPVPRPARKER